MGKTKEYATKDLAREVMQGQEAALARALSWAQERHPELPVLLALLNPQGQVPIMGITGAPGSGKSTLVSALLGHWSKEGTRTGVLAVDPSSPFHGGALLGDRIRMSAHFQDPGVFIRSVSARGALGGLSAQTFEMAHIMQSAGFDRVLIETVGVGQNEMDVCGLADLTVLVLVPDFGDEIQGIKSGIMEVANVLVLNKYDLPGGEAYLKKLKKLVLERSPHSPTLKGEGAGPPSQNYSAQIPVLACSALKNTGIPELAMELDRQLSSGAHALPDHVRALYWADRAWHILREHRMQDLDPEQFRKEVAAALNKNDFNLFGFLKNYGYGS